MFGQEMTCGLGVGCALVLVCMHLCYVRKCTQKTHGRSLPFRKHELWIIGSQPLLTTTQRGHWVALARWGCDPVGSTDETLWLQTQMLPNMLMSACSTARSCALVDPLALPALQHLGMLWPTAFLLSWLFVTNVPGRDPANPCFWVEHQY